MAEVKGRQRGVSITEQEQKVLNLTADVWNEFCKLPVQHPDGTQEFKHDLHGLQRHILARPAERVERGLPLSEELRRDS